MELSFYWSLLFAMLFQKDYQKKVCSGYLPFLQMGSRDSSVVRALDLLYERSWLRIPAGAVREFSSSGSTFCADSYFGIRSTPVLP